MKHLLAIALCLFSLNVGAVSTNGFFAYLSTDGSQTNIPGYQAYHFDNPSNTYSGSGAGLTGIIVPGDNLGNHTATSDVNVAQNSLTNVYQVRSGGASDPVMSFWYDRNGTMYEALQFGNDTDGYGIQVITNSQHSGFYGADGGVLLDWQNQTLWGWGPTLWNAMDANITAVSNVAVNVATNSLSHGNWGFTIPDPTNATWNFVEVYPDYAGVATGVCWKSMGYSAGYIGYVANSHTSRVDNHGAVLQQLWSTGGVETCFSLTNAHTADGVYHLVFTNCATATNIVGKIRY